MCISKPPAVAGPDHNPGDHITITTNSDDDSVLVDGAVIRYRAWGDPMNAGLLFIHGSAANSHWWDHLVAPFARTHRVVAMDMSGHGDSGHRDRYTHRTWAREVRAVIEDALGPRPVIIGHSMGGKIAVHAAMTYPDSLGGLVVLDSRLTPRPDRSAVEQFAARALSDHRIYSTDDDAIAAFRPFGSARPLVPELAGHVAARSIRPVADGWTWKFDVGVYASVLDDPPDLRPFHRPVALLRAETDSVVDDETIELLASVASADFVTAVLPGSGHHVMFDNPAGLSSWLLDVLNRWEQPGERHPKLRPR